MSIKLDTAKELQIRQHINDELVAVYPLTYVINTAKDFGGKEHFFSWVGLTNDDADDFAEKEAKLKANLVKYAMLYCVNLTNDPVIGAAHCPNKFLDYNIEIFQENDRDNDEYSSHDNFIDTIIQTDFAFLTGQDMSPIQSVRRSQLQSLAPWNTDLESRRVPGVRGHFGLFRIRVEAM